MTQRFRAPLIERTVPPCRTPARKAAHQPGLALILALSHLTVVACAGDGLERPSASSSDLDGSVLDGEVFRAGDSGTEEGDASTSDAASRDGSIGDGRTSDGSSADGSATDASTGDGSSTNGFPPNLVVVVDPDQVTGADLGLTGGGAVYNLDSLLDAVIGRLNQDKLRVVYGKRNQSRSPEGLSPWVEDFRRRSPSPLEIRAVTSSEDLLRLAAEFFDEILTYPPNPVDWSYDGSALIKEAPKGDGHYTWIDEKYNFNRYLALNFVNLRRALIVPETVAVNSGRLREWLNGKPVRSLREVIEDLEPSGWSRWGDSANAHRFILEHVAPRLNPAFVCVNTAFDVCVLENGLSIGSVRAGLYSPLEALLLDEILESTSRRLPAGAFGSMVGWSGEERVFGCIASKNRYGISLEMNRGYAALHQMPASASHFDLNDHVVLEDIPVEQRVYDPSRRYVAIVLSDGNSDQSMGRHGGAWAAYHSSQSTRIPLTWQVRPSVLEYAPILAQYLYETRFSTDYFMIGPSGPLYVHFTGLGTAVDTYGALLDRASEQFGLRIYETWAGYHPTVEDIFEKPTDPDNPSIPNPFPALYATLPWPGEPRELLSKILVCRQSQEEATAFPRTALFDDIRSSARRIEAVTGRSSVRQEDIFDDRPAAFLHHPLGLWNKYPKNAANELDVEELGNVLFRHYGWSGQFALFTAYLFEPDFKAGMTFTDVQRLAAHFASRGVTLVTGGQYLDLKRQCLTRAPSTNTSCR